TGVSFPCAAAPRHRLGEDAAAAADVQHFLAGERRALIDPLQAQRIDLMEGTEFAFGIPPARGERAEFLELAWIDIHSRWMVQKKSPAEAGLLLARNQITGSSPSSTASRS